MKVKVKKKFGCNLTIQQLIDENKIVLDVFLRYLSKIRLHDIDDFQQKLKNHSSINILFCHSCQPNIRSLWNENNYYLFHSHLLFKVFFLPLYEKSLFLQYLLLAIELADERELHLREKRPRHFVRYHRDIREKSRLRPYDCIQKAPQSSFSSSNIAAGKIDFLSRIFKVPEKILLFCKQKNIHFLITIASLFSTQYSDV
jgi:hypothetical protein